ncbi:hypothetical protein AQZ52_03630 [Novosphingobium fuchskuhlense]|uniref:DUF4136 domain-containing protein n=1 Tax=Novosphingobium fuchskuhlense TaxID=1117702 RepID=A0A124JVJ9_9SPHN|nr:DUF4136 domain-containing protein [Novosphingobium fuchskuhlense]KUR72364.1 hypothetical protein AQZ52_03630 [Novosphingobium fuchskuhlense]
MKARLLLAALALVAAPALAAPVEVTRFHTPESITALGRGAIAVVAAPGMDAASLETNTWLRAVEAELSALRFGTATPGAADATAEVRVEREVQRTERQRGPVSVGVGGSTGGWNSGFGLGLGFSLGGGPKTRVITRLVVTIRSRATGLSLWEGRADNTEREKSKAASVDQAAPRLAHALFSGFPGTSGATITVK